MISAVFIRKNGSITKAVISGHADYACGNDEYDMVCSAVSAVSLTIGNGITQVLKVNGNIYAEDGFLNIDIHDAYLHDIERCQVLLETMLLGLKSIELNYHDYIKVKEEEV